MKSYDAIVIGAGHNGLTNAAFLAKAGLKTLVVEKNPHIGGAAVSRELYDGWIYSNCSYVCSLLRPEIYRALNLGKYGLAVVPYGGGVTLMKNGDYFGNYSDHEMQYREFYRHSPRDADAYERYITDMLRYCRFIRPFLMRTPPDPTSFRPRNISELLYLVRKLYDLGEEQLYELIRFFTMSVAEFLDEYFQSDIVKAQLSGGGIIGTALGPYSPGTAYVLLHHYMGDVDGNVGAWGFARGGMGAISNAMAGALQDYGGEIRTSAPVERILVGTSRVKGVVLEGGEEIRAKIVVSNLDAKRTYLNVMDEKDVPDHVIEMAKNFKIRGSSGKLNIALDGLPEFPALPPKSPLMHGDMHFIDSLERMKRAYDDWKNDT